MADFARLLKPASHSIKEKRRQSVSGAVQVARAQEVTFASEQLTPAQKRGLRYERRVGAKLETLAQAFGAELWNKQWLIYNKGRKSRLAQPDFVLVFPSKAAILFEVKLTYTNCLHQLAFYADLLRAYGLGPITIGLICRNLTPEVPKESLITCLEDIHSGSTWPLRL